MGFVGFVSSAMRIPFPHPEFRILRTQCEDPGVPGRVIRIQAHRLHVRADRLGGLTQGGMGVPFPLPEILRLRIRLKGDVVVTEGVRRAVLGDEDVGLESEGTHVFAVQGHRLVRGSLPGFQTTDPQETLADVGEGLRIVLEPGSRLPDFEEAEGFHERDCGTCLGTGIECRDPRLYEVVHLFEYARFPIEEALEEGHPYHPIPRDAAPRRGASDKWPTCEWMAYRYRQRPSRLGQTPHTHRPGDRRQCD